MIRYAEDVLPESKVFRYEKGAFTGHLSGFSDWFRYELLLERGGWWADTDIICLRPFTSSQRFVFASGWEPGYDGYVNNNVIFAGEPGERIFADAAAECRRIGRRAEHCETGPVLLHRLVGEYDFSHFVSAPHVFNPVHYADVDKLHSSRFLMSLITLGRALRRLRPILLRRTSCALHLYAATLERRAAIRDLSEIPKRSVLYHILSRNGAITR